MRFIFPLVACLSLGCGQILQPPMLSASKHDLPYSNEEFTTVEQYPKTQLVIDIPSDWKYSTNHVDLLNNDSPVIFMAQSFQTYGKKKITIVVNNVLSEGTPEQFAAGVAQEVIMKKLITSAKPIYVNGTPASRLTFIDGSTRFEQVNVAMYNTGYITLCIGDNVVEVAEICDKLFSTMFIKVNNDITVSH